MAIGILRSRSHLSEMVHISDVTLVRRIGLDLIPHLEGVSLQVRGLIDMQAYFVAGHIMDRIEFSVDFQNVAFDDLRASGF